MIISPQKARWGASTDEVLRFSGRNDGWFGAGGELGE